MKWDDIYRNSSLKEIPWHSDKAPAALVKSLKAIKKGHALDVCCGAGTNSIYLAEKGFKVKGIDISKKAIEIAKNRAKKEKVNIDFKAGDVLRIDGKNKFDFVFDRGCFHHIPKQGKKKFIKKIHNALKKDGKYLLMSFSDKNNFKKSLSKQDISNYFSRYFMIGDIKEEMHTEPDNSKVYLYTTLMTKI